MTSHEEFLSGTIKTLHQNIHRVESSTVFNRTIKKEMIGPWLHKIAELERRLSAPQPRQRALL